MLRIYLDTCCFNRPYDDQSHIRNSLEAQAKLHIQSATRERFDYTQWQCARFDDEDLESLNAAATAWATEYEANHDMK